MTDIQKPPKLTPKQNVPATFAAIQKLLADEEMPARVVLIQVAALATFAEQEVRAIQELRKPRREKKSA